MRVTVEQILTERRKMAALFCVLCLIYSGASAIVTHDDNQPQDHPADKVVGRWGSNASCVAIGPDLIITTRHQGSSSRVEIGGVTYQVAQQWYNDDDFRIARLTLDGQRANLSHWISISENTYTDTAVVFGGFGRSRGEPLIGTSDNVYGYSWLSETNTTLRWGANMINYTSSGRLVADFDAATHSSAVIFEAAIAEYDSGGGWFVKQGGKWVLAGLSNGVSNFGSSMFAAEDGSSKPDAVYAIALGQHADWIKETLADLMPKTGDTDFDGDVDAEDTANISANYGKTGTAGWSMGNFDGDGDVDLVDLGLAASGN